VILPLGFVRAFQLDLQHNARLPGVECMINEDRRNPQTHARRTLAPNAARGGVGWRRAGVGGARACFSGATPCSGAPPSVLSSAGGSGRAGPAGIARFLNAHCKQRNQASNVIYHMSNHSLFDS